MTFKNPESPKLNFSWHRGDNTNFLPSLKTIKTSKFVDVVNKYILEGWLPNAPFINRSCKIVSIGSCFARNISFYLKKKKYDVYTGTGIGEGIVFSGEGIVNSFAIWEQFNWALNNADVENGYWYDENKTQLIPSEDLRSEAKNVLQSGDIFIITLGLSEIWYNKVNNQVFWRAIPKHFFDEDIHGFRVSSVSENYYNINNIYETVMKWRPGAKIILTLSPIPLMATFREISCLSANSVSKAILRAAIDEVMRQNLTNLYYFPSYEIVKELPYYPFQEDNRHPKPEVLEFIMERFEENYCA